MPPVSTERRTWAFAALVWLAVVLAIAGHQWHFWRHTAIDTDVLALLPENEHEPEITEATRRLADRAQRQVIVLLGAPDWPAAKAAAAAWRQALPAST
ncbi:MAG: hypothetical protein ABW067_09525, partial [Rhizobacter sp.]